MKPFFSESDCDVFDATQAAFTKQRPTAVSVDKANRLIAERSKVVYGNIASKESGWSEVEYLELDTHTARLICVEEIEKDTAEGLLKELVKNQRVLGFEPGFSMDKFVERARKLLEAK